MRGQEEGGDIIQPALLAMSEPLLTPLGDALRGPLCLAEGRAEIRGL